MSDCVELTVNGIKHSVGCEVSSDTTLLLYIRNYLELRGTKYMCLEGGCGACIINASTSPGSPAMAVNACLVSVLSCHGWNITTIEGLGNRCDGYHPIQKAVAENNATQCGYCTPGMVMSMNGLIQTNKDLTMMDIEKGFGSNVCRCTGYRPLAQCFRKFAKDAPKEDRIVDIENLSLCKKKGNSCNKSGRADEEDWCMIQDNGVFEDATKKIKLKDGKMWYKPNSLADVLVILKDQKSLSDYMLVGGNTAKGAFPIDECAQIMIDVSTLQELKEEKMDQNLIAGAGLTLTQFMNILKTYSIVDYFSYLKKLYDHVDLVAHHPVRNVGTVAGNLMTKYNHNSFQSDIFLILETVGAQLTIVDSDGNKTTCTMQGFLKLDMTRKVIYNVLLPPLNDEYHLVTFKVMPRAQSAHAMINAGFLYKYDKTTYIVKEARIVYGALSPKFIRATITESYLIGKSLFKNETLQAALKILDGELIIEDNPPEASVEYRRSTARTLLYKGMLSLCPSTIRAPRYESGAVKLHEARGLSDGKQNYTTNILKYPLTKPVQKVEAMIQSAGEAVFTEDLPSLPNEVFGAFVLSTVGVGKIESIDATDALKMDGVVALYTAKDIPGLNSFTPADHLTYITNEEVLADGDVKHYHQPLAIVVAETQQIANRAVKRVKVNYSNVKKPVIDVKEAKDMLLRNIPFFTIIATKIGIDIRKIISGQQTFYGQYHFTMETLVTVAKPTEEGLEVHASTQWHDGPHLMISRALNIPQNKIDVHTRRIGGGYGMKISRSIQGAVACSLVSYKLNRPCRFIQPLTTNMEAHGKRLPCANDYTVAVNKSGQIQYINHKLYEDNGYKLNETLTLFGIDAYYNVYDAGRFHYTGFNTLTDTAKNTWCRSPATLEAVAAVEGVMERISYELSLDPVEVRLANLSSKHESDITDMVKQLKKDAEYATRRAAVDSFNTQNRWKKRGLRFSFCKWAPLGAQRLNMTLSVYQDATIIVTHGGIEMGQGLNTKAAQLVAYYLKVPMEKIQIKGNSTIIAPNGFMTGGCLTTSSIIIGLRRCCEEMMSKLLPIKEKLLKENPTETAIVWELIIKAAYTLGVDLQVHGSAGLLDIQLYDILGMAMTEVEIDCLTGEYDILQVDILQDVGMSLSPEIDVGQVEGGFMMGVGYWTCEKLVYERVTGKLLTNRTWDYHVPQMRDMPKIFNVSFKKNSYSNDVILGSKGTGEPSTCIAVAVPFAIREALAMCRQECGIPTTEWFDIDGPHTTEAVGLACGTKIEHMKFY